MLARPRGILAALLILLGFATAPVHSGGLTVPAGEGGSGGGGSSSASGGYAVTNPLGSLYNPGLGTGIVALRDHSVPQVYLPPSVMRSHTGGATRLMLGRNSCTSPRQGMRWP